MSAESAPHVSLPLAHHFDDLPQQHAAGELGMWIFLCTEVMFFGGLFLAYTIYRNQDEAAFAAASHELDLFWGTVNTVVLLTSSLTMALAVRSAESLRRKELMALLAATVVLGSVFIGIKGMEYHHKYLHQLMPLGGLPFVWEGPSAGHAEMFFNLYFLMTGLHAVHMIIGLGIMSVMLWLSWRGTITKDYYNPVEIAGLYWHFVDIVWIFLFPLLYLLGRHGIH